MFEKRYVFHNKLNRGHQKKWCQNGVGGDLTKSLKFDKGTNKKNGRFWRASKKQFLRLHSLVKFGWKSKWIYNKNEIYVIMSLDVWKKMTKKKTENVIKPVWFETHIKIIDFQMILQTFPKFFKKNVTSIWAYNYWCFWKSLKNQCQYHCRRMTN